MTRDQMVNAK